MEILAPVGSAESLAAAIDGGADAIYLGGKQFGARKFSANFDDNELEGAIGYAHDRGVKVYVTVNTIVKDSEMMEAVSFVRFLKNIGADAVIVQDVGLLKAISGIDVEKHASTQMGIHSASGLRWCHENGITRAILARELTLEELSEAVKDSPLETEVFVQGALCYSMSGGCLFSSMAGGRSGNRGECAQPCRKRYSGVGREGYLMNTRDLYCIDLLSDLERIGITSVKIEGRMRSPVHSYLTSKLYSLVKNNGPDTEIKETSKLLETIFNRGYGHGYMDGVGEVVQPLYPDNRGLFLGTAEIKRGRFDMHALGIGMKDGISIFSGEEKVGGFKVSEMNSAVPFKIRDGIYEIYRTYDPRIDAVKNTFSRVPPLEGRTKRPPAARISPIRPREPGRAELSVYVSSVKVLEEVIETADRIYFERNSSIGDARRICSEMDKELVTILPRFTVNDMTENDVMVHNIGQMHANCSGRVYGSHHMNMYNSFFPGGYQMTLSSEASRNEIWDIAGRYGGRIEVMVFGRMELMVTRDPEMPSGTITDEKGFQFPVYRDRDGWAHILNSSDLLLINHATEMDKMGIDSFGIDLRRRPADLARAVLDSFKERDASRKEKIKDMCGSITYGHYLKGLS